MKRLTSYIAALVAVALLGSGAYFGAEIDRANIPEHLKLKATPDKFLNTRAFEYVKQDDAGNEVSRIPAVAYSYISETPVPLELNEVVERRTEHSKTFLVSRGATSTTYQAVIYAGSPQFWNDNGVWKYVEYATTTQSDYEKQTNAWVQTAHAQTTFFPSVDGSCESNSTVSYATVHDLTAANRPGGCHLTDTDVAINNGFNGSTWAIWRGATYYNTASIGSGSTVTAATLSLHGSAVGKDDAGDADAINTYAFTPASTATIDIDDYDQCGTTAFANTAVTIAAWNNSAYNDMAFNATGMAAINKTGVSTFCHRTTDDAANNAPSFNDYVFFRTSETSGTSNDPKLVVTFSVVSAAVKVPDIIIFD